MADGLRKGRTWRWRQPNCGGGLRGGKRGGESEVARFTPPIGCLAPLIGFRVGKGGTTGVDGRRRGQ